MKETFNDYLIKDEGLPRSDVNIHRERLYERRDGVSIIAVIYTHAEGRQWFALEGVKLSNEACIIYSHPIYYEIELLEDKENLAEMLSGYVRAVMHLTTFKVEDVKKKFRPIN